MEKRSDKYSGKSSMNQKSSSRMEVANEYEMGSQMKKHKSASSSTSSYSSSSSKASKQQGKTK